MKNTKVLILCIFTFFSCSKDDNDYREKYFGNYDAEITYNYQSVFVDSLITDTIFKARRIVTVSKFMVYYCYQGIIYPDTGKMLDIIYDNNLKSEILYSGHNAYCVYMHGYIHPNISENGILEYPEFVGPPWSGFHFEGKIENDSINIYYGDSSSTYSRLWSYTIKGKKIE